MKKIFLVFLFLGVASLAASETQVTEQKVNSTPQPARTLILNWFQVGAGAMIDSDGGFSGASGFSWIPTYRFNSAWRMKLSLGGMMSNLGTNRSFFLGDGALSVVYTEARPFTFEVGGGYQYWEGRRNFHPLLRAGFGYRLIGEPSLIHAINLYYSKVFTPVVTNHQFTVAVSIRF
jgi:hypothetical protein